MSDPIIQTTDLEATFQALRHRDPIQVGKERIPHHHDYKDVPSRNFAPTVAVNTGSWGSPMMRTASFNGPPGIIYGQPQF